MTKLILTSDPQIFVLSFIVVHVFSLAFVQPKRATHTFESEKDGIKDEQLGVQYCMCYVRHVLQARPRPISPVSSPPPPRHPIHPTALLWQAVESPAVTQARGSGDYRAGNEQWRPLGLTSLLLYALGLAASKARCLPSAPPHALRTGPLLTSLPP